MKKSLLLTDLTEYLRYKALYLRPNSYKVYRLFGDNFKEFLTDNNLNNLQTRKVTPVICEDYKRFILKKYSHPVTRNKEILQMKCFFNQFVQLGWERYRISPATHIQFVPKQDSEMHEPFSDKQIEIIIDRIIEKEDYYLLLYIYFIFYTFSRPGREVRLMKVGDIKKQTVLIRSENSKNRHTKSPALTRPLDELLKRLKVRDYPNNWYVFGRGGKPSLEPVGVNYYYNRHREILQELGIDGMHYTLYGWKHTGNIRAVKLGIGERHLQIQNGFRASTVLEIYLRRLSSYFSGEIYEKFN